jgi:hypothetical protein
MNEAEISYRSLPELTGFTNFLYHPARLAILKLPAENRKCISTDNSYNFLTDKTPVCQHLKELINSGLTKGEIGGLKIYYYLSKCIINAYMQIFHGFLREILSVYVQCEII